MKNNGAIKIAKLYADWIHERSTSQSAHTIKSYSTSMLLFLQYLENKKKINVGEFCAEQMFSHETIQDWMDWLEKERKCSAQTCNVRLANIRSFVKYMAERDLTYRYIFMDVSCVRPMKTNKKKVEGITKRAVKALLGCPDTKTRVGFRDAVLLSMLYTTATRVDELLSIKLQDINLDVEYPYVIILGKGSKIRTLNLPKKLTEMLKHYIQVFHSEKYAPSNYLFYSREKGMNFKLSAMGLHKRIRIYAERANKTSNEVPVDLHAHQLRHARATHLLDDGLNIAQLSKFLGHENIATTMIYLDITEDMKSSAIKTRMNEQIKAVKPKWNKSNVKSLISIFGFNKT